MEKRIIFRLPDEMARQISQIVAERNFKNTSDFMRAAISKFLKEVDQNG